MDDVSEKYEDFNVSTITHLITHLEPYTQYAYYVKTYTLSSVSMGAISPIQYFRTAPGEPTVVQKIQYSSNDSSVIQLNWEPPRKSNGHLVSYVIRAKPLEENKNQIAQRNYCLERKLL